MLEHYDLLISALSDPVTSVAAAARDALATHPNHLNGPALWALYEQAPLEHTRRFAMHLLRRLPLWLRVAYLLRIAKHSPDDALQSLWSWSVQANNTFTPMPNDVYEDALRALKSAWGILPYGLNEKIAGVIRAKRSS